MALLNLKNKKSGYTLLEILISFAIFGILLGIIVFGFRDARSIEGFKGATALFASQIKEIQNWALTGKEAGGKVPVGGYGIHIDLSKAAKTDLEPGDNQYIVFGDSVLIDVDNTEPCVAGGNQRFDSRNFKNANYQRCLGNPKDLKISPEGSVFGKNIILDKIIINDSEGIREISPSPTEDRVLDIAFKNFTPFPFIGTCSTSICRDPNNNNYDSKKINTLALYFMETKLNMCRKITVFGSSGMVQEESADCPN